MVDVCNAGICHLDVCYVGVYRVYICYVGVCRDAFKSVRVVSIV